MLISREIPTCVITIQTDGQTDDLLWQYSALRRSRGKNRSIFAKVILEIKPARFLSHGV